MKISNHFYLGRFSDHLSRMGYTRGIVVQYQYQGAGIGIVLVLLKNHLYPIPDQYQSFTGKAAIRNKEITQKIYYQKHMTSKQWETKNLTIYSTFHSLY